MARSSIRDQIPALSARTIADQAPIGIFRADPAGLINYINPALERISGVTSVRALGNSWLRSAPADTRDEAERLWKTAIAERRNLETEFRFKHPDGSIRYALIVMAAHYGPRGKLRGFTGFVTDVTAQRADQAALRKSERLYRLLAENSTDIICRLDLDDHVTYASPAMGEVTGFSAEETRGINPISFMHPDDAPAARESSRQLKAGEIEQAVIEYRTPRKNDGYIWVEARSRLVRNNRGEPQEVISVVRNIAVHKKLEADLIAAREAEEQASAAQSRFLAAMSHEIRTPISGVIGMIDLMINSGDDAQQPRYRNALAASARTLLRVVDDVLDYSRLSDVGITLERAPFDVFAAVHAVIDLYRPAAEAKGLVVGLQFQAPTRIAVGDPTRIGQVLGNLMSNAIKFTEVGRIDIEVDQRAGGWRFAVRDTGIGLTGAQRERLFQAFVQADDSIAARFGGSGLGLALSRLIVEAKGGSLTVESEPGRGSIFAFTVPLGTPGNADQAQHVSNDHPNEDRQLRLLVAEDNEVNLLYLSSLLDGMGHQVTTVTDGQAAIEAALEMDFDAVLLDRHMPRLDGLSAARAIRGRRDGPVPMLVLVSAANPSTGAEADEEASLFDASVPKPVRREQLQAVLAECQQRDAARSSRRTDLEEALGADAANELERLFRIDIAARLDPLDQALATSDAQALRDHAHAIVGAAQLIGEPGIADAALDTEQAPASDILSFARTLRDTCARYLSV